MACRSCKNAWDIYFVDICVENKQNGSQYNG